MVDLASQYQKIKKEIDAEIQQVIDTTSFVKGAKVEEFAKHLEEYLNIKHVIPVGNGTDALQIALMALGLKEGDEVITSAFTFVSTAEVIALLGLTPVFVDVDPDTFCISAENVRKAITPKTKVIIPVHLFGQNADMEKLLQIALEHHLYIIEDACQSIGSLYTFSDGNILQSGCMGEIGCTSFFPSKNLGCFGDGGALFTNNNVLAGIMRSVANHGMEVRYCYDRIGVNSRLDSIQAAVLDVKLKYLDNYIAERRAAAEYYDNAFRSNDKIRIPVRSLKSTHVFHQYTLVLDGVDRSLLQQKLAERKIPSMIYYPVPLHLQKAYKSNRYKAGDLPVTEYLSENVLSLPMHTELDEEQLNYIVNNVLDLIKIC
jgi:dTDP-4-amino-4,6-dideoxygalactose transaminase